MLLSSLLMPLFFVTEGILLFVVLGLLGMILISTFSVTIVMAQHLIRRAWVSPRGSWQVLPSAPGDLRDAAGSDR